MSVARHSAARSPEALVTGSDAHLAAELLTSELAADCFAARRTSADGTDDLVLYFVPKGALPPGWRAELSQHHSGAQLIPVTCLPRDASGAVDLSALEPIPCLDESLAERWETALKFLPGIRDAVVVLRDSREDDPPLHLWDLLPGTAAPSASADSQSVRRAEAGPTTAATLSHSVGSPLAEPVPLNLAEALVAAAEARPTQGLIHVQPDGTEVRQGYADLLESAQRVLGGLRRMGVEPGDRVILQVELPRDFLPAFWGCVLGGFIPIPLQIAPTYSHMNGALAKLQNAWQMLGNPVVVASSRLAPLIQALPSVMEFAELPVVDVAALLASSRDTTHHVAASDETTLLLLTSGSTGMPKAVALTHGNILSRCAACKQMNGFHSQDVSINWFPLDHVGGIVMFHLRDVYLKSIQLNAPTELVLEDPLRWLDWIERHRATITWAPNFAFGLINDQAETLQTRRYDLSSMRFILNAGEAIVSRTTRRFMRLLEPFGLNPECMKPAWGMSETSSAVAYSHEYRVDTTSDDDPFVEVGPPIPGTEFRIVDAEDRLVPEGTIGRLQVRGRTVLRGYFRNSELNEQVFTGDGWFKTGDLGVLRGGSLTITGREKDLIIINGVNFYSHELESVVEEVDGVEVSFTAASAVRDAGSETDRVAIFFVPTSPDPEDLADVMERIRARLVQDAGVNPDVILPLPREEIPKTAIGKIQRSQLRQRFEAGEFREVQKAIDLRCRTAQTLPDWFLRAGWRPAMPAISQRGLSGEVLILADGPMAGAPIAGRVAAALDRYGIACSLLPPELDKLTDALAALGDAESRAGAVLDCRAVASGIADDWRDAIEASVPMARACLAGLGRTESDRLPLFVASRTASVVIPGDRPGLHAAALGGVVRTTARESQRVPCTHIDIGEQEEALAAECIVREILAMAGEPAVGYRDGVRHVPVLQRLPVLATPVGVQLVREGGSYVLVGAPNSVGLETAKVLLRDYCARVGYVTSAPAEQVQKELSGIRTGELVVHTTDLGSQQALLAVVEGIEAAWGNPVDAVVLCGGARWERAVAEQTVSELEAAIAGFASSAEAATTALAQRDTPIVAYTQASAFLGDASGAAYHAATGILDTLMQRRREAGRPATTIAWSLWEAGLSAGLLGSARASGYLPISAREGVISLAAILNRGITEALVGLDPGHPGIRRHLAAPPAAWQRLTGYWTGHEPRSVRAAFAHLAIADRYGVSTQCELFHLPEVPRDEDGRADRVALSRLGRPRVGAAPDDSAPETETEQRLAEIWKEVLAVQRVGRHHNFFQLGGHSLLAAKVLARIRQSFGVELALRHLFEGPTIAELGAAVEQSQIEHAAPDELADLLDELEGLSEAEVLALLAADG